MDDNLQKADSYSPPQSVRNNAKRGLKLREKYGRGGLSTGEAGKQGIGSGVARARDLASGKGLSLATVKRMHAFFSRHRKNKDSRKPNGEPGAGMIAWLLWGGDSGASWAKGIAQKETKKAECKSADGCKLGDVCKKAGSCQYGQKGYKKDEGEDEVNTVSCEVVKMDASRRLVFGFAVVSKIDGEDYYDRHGDHIPEDEVLNASLAFAKSAAPANVNHKGPDVGSHPFVFPLTTEIAKSLGIETSRTGLLIGQQVDPETFAKFESGELRAFSIEGVAVPEEQ